MTPEYSIVVPVYQAEKSLENLIAELKAYASAQQINCEFIFVDDSSSDKSWEFLKKIKRENSNVKIIRFAKNFGQHAATLCGFKYSKGNLVITLDDDLEVHPSQITALIQEYKKSGNDLVYGEYRKLNQPFLRGVLTKLYKSGAKLAEKDRKKGKGSPFRLIKGDLARKIADSHKHFVFIDELLLWYTDKISFIKVEANKNYIQKGGYSFHKLFRLTLNLVMFSSTFPLKLVTNIGIMLALVNFLIGVWFIVKKFWFRVQVPGYTSIIVSVLFSTGLIILSIGIVAQYISLILKDVNNKPSYHIAEEIVTD